MLGRRETLRLIVGLGGDDVDPDHRIGTLELLRRLEAVAVDMQRRDQQFGGEMRRESIRQPQLGSEHRAEIARSENPERHFRAGRRYGLNSLAGNDWRQERLQFENVLRKRIRRLRRAAQSAQRQLVGAGSATKSKIDAARKETSQRPELLGDNIGRRWAA